MKIVTAGRSIALLSLLLVSGTTGCRDNVNDDSVTIIQTALVSASSSGTLSNGTLEEVPSSTSINGRYVAFASSATNLSPDDTDTSIDIFVRDTLLGTTELISRASGTPGLPSNGTSGAPKISPDGQWVVYHSNATNLVPTPNPPLNEDINRIYLRNRLTNITKLVTPPDDSVCMNPSISVVAGQPQPDIRISFESDADYLALADNNQVMDVFVIKDAIGFPYTYLASRVAGANSQHLGSTQTCTHTKDTESKSGVLSANGKYVAFLSTEHFMGFSGCTEPDLKPGDLVLFVRELDGNHNTIHVSLGFGDHSDINNCFQPTSNFSISADGSTIAFDTRGHLRLSSLPIAPINPSTNSDIYVRIIDLHDLSDYTKHTTELVSRHTSGTASEGESSHPSVSSDGNRVAFRSSWSGFVNNDANGVTDIFLRNRSAGTTDRISLDTYGNEPTLESNYPSLSPEGYYCTFQTASPNLTDDDFNGEEDLFIRGPLD